MRDFTGVSAVALKALENDGKELAILLEFRCQMSLGPARKVGNG
jgi:hypothetical protein